MSQLYEGGGEVLCLQTWEVGSCPRWIQIASNEPQCKEADEPISGVCVSELTT